MVVVDDVANLLRQLSTKWVNIKVAVAATVGHAVDGFTANVTDGRRPVMGLGFRENEREWVAVEGGGELVGAISAVHVEVGDADVASESVAETGGFAGGADVIGMVGCVVNEVVVWMDMGEVGVEILGQCSHFCVCL